MHSSGIEQLLEDLLAALRSEDRPTEEDLPRVTLHLASGQSLSGAIVDRVHHDCIVLQEDELEQHHVTMHGIVAVSVHDSIDAADVLSGGRAERPGEARTPEELQRDLDQIGEELGVALEAEDIPEDNDARIALTHVLENVRDALTEIFDEHGEEARESFARVCLEDADAAGVERREDAVVVSADLTSGPCGRLPVDELRTALLGAS